MHAIPDDALAVLRHYRTCEMSTIGKDGTPQTWPLCPRLLDDGRILMTTSIGLPGKAFNIRRNPKVSLLFSEPKASGVARPGAVLVQGDATAEDNIISDPASIPELRRYFVETIFARQPGGKMVSSWLGRWLIWPYYMRLVLYVTPRRMLWWPTRDFTQAPQVILGRTTTEAANVG